MHVVVSLRTFWKLSHRSVRLNQSYYCEYSDFKFHLSLFSNEKSYDASNVGENRPSECRMRRVSLPESDSSGGKSVCNQQPWKQRSGKTGGDLDAGS